jgi:sugar transporter
MCLLPNAGHFAHIMNVMVFSLVALMFLDTSINMAMQPFKMLVGDMVNEKQKGLAYSIQSFLSNAGSLVGYLFPFIFTFIGINNTAEKGLIPDSVIYSFYIGAAILILCSLYTSIKVKEMPPKKFEEFHRISTIQKKEKSDFISLLKNAPKVFWTIGLVQFFSWAAFMYMWTYTNGAIASNVWGVTDTSSAAYQEAGNWVGVVFAVQAVGSVCWAVILPLFKSRKIAYSLSLALGGIGFISTIFVHEQHLLFLPFFLIGFAWAAMLAMPFTILTNSISGKNMGTYLGLFNGTICIPQIIAALGGGSILHILGGLQINMLVLAGIFLLIGAICVSFIKETYAELSSKFQS